MHYRKIPDETIRRLPIYLRDLTGFSQQGYKNISSKELSGHLGINPWQIRKDLSNFGAFGTCGVGYNIDKLIRQIKKILKLDTIHKAALVGVGNLGSAVLAYPGFALYGFDIVAAFDNDHKKIGKKINKITIEDISKIPSLRNKNVRIGIITVPREESQKTADSLVSACVTGILNFSPCRIKVPKKVKVITINIALDFARLPYYMPAR